MKPNVLFIMTDQFRADALGCVGGYAKTPTLDVLANRGWLFENAYSNSPECIPARLSLATGLYPHQTGIDHNQGITLNPDFPNWMQAVERAGYRTSLFGKTHLHKKKMDARDYLPLMNRYGLQHVDEISGPRDLRRLNCRLTELWQQTDAWDAYRSDLEDRFATKPFVARPSTLPLELYYDTYVRQMARQYLRELARDDTPWFCWVSFSAPHVWRRGL